MAVLKILKYQSTETEKKTDFGPTSQKFLLVFIVAQLKNMGLE